MSKSRRVSFPLLRGNRVADLKRRKRTDTRPCPPVRGPYMSACRGRQRLFSRFSAIAGSGLAEAPPFRGHPAAGKSHALSAAGSAPREVCRTMPLRLGSGGSGAPGVGKAGRPGPRLTRFSKSDRKRRSRWGLARFRCNLCKRSKIALQGGPEEFSEPYQTVKSKSAPSPFGRAHVVAPPRFVKGSAAASELQLISGAAAACLSGS
jgi:hypothetical protein